MLLVFSDDWGRHPSSCQHLVRRLLDDRRVTWVNTIGMRPPTLDLATVGRAWEKLRHWSSPEPAAETHPKLRVINPRMWPWFRRRHDRWLNRRLLLRTLLPIIETADEPVTAVTTIPIVADLMGPLPVARWVYYCVDDFSVWPGLDQRAMLAMEQQVVERCDALIAVSETLQQRLADWGRNSHLLTHGVDLDFWAESTGSKPKTADTAPNIVFWGVIDRRMDVDWIVRLAADMTSGTIQLIGPLADPDERLLRLPRVVHRPPQPLTALPALAAAAGVLVMPYADLPVTRAMQPLKLKEYLATGKPVVVRDLPSTRCWADCLDVAGSAESFSALVRERIAGGVPPAQLSARRRLSAESWDEKARLFAQHLQPENSPAPAAAEALTA